MVWQIEWFANKAGTTIGTIALGKEDEGWNYAVLSRDRTGNFRVRKLGGDAFSLDDARAELLLEMAAAVLAETAAITAPPAEASAAARRTSSSVPT